MKLSLTVDEIKSVYKEIISRQENESAWVKSNGKEVTTDVGFAAEGAYLFLAELIAYARKKTR